MKLTKDFYKKGYTASRFTFLYVFVSGLAAVIVYACLGLYIPLLSGFSMNSLLSAEMMYLEAVTKEGLLEGEATVFLVTGIVVAIAELVPYLLAFILSGKHYGWTKAGALIYLIDTGLSFLLLFVDIGEGAADPLYYVPFILIHIAVMGAIGFCLYAGGQVFPKKQYAYSAPFGAQSFGNGAFGTVRTLCIMTSASQHDAAFTYHINGATLGIVSPGQTRIVMLDGNYQRLVVTAPGCIPKETVIPAGSENVSFSLCIILNDKGERSVCILPV